MPGVQLQGRLAVGAAFGVHAVDDAQVVDVPGDVREQLGDPAAALAVLGELPGRLGSSGVFFLRGSSPVAAFTKGAGWPEYLASAGL